MVCALAGLRLPSRSRDVSFIFLVTSTFRVWLLKQPTYCPGVNPHTLLDLQYTTLTVQSAHQESL